LIGQLCDACVYSKSGVYSAAVLMNSPELAQTAAEIFAHRFGVAAGKEILLTGAEYSGEELRRRVGTLLVTEREQVPARAVEVAAAWAEIPRTVLTDWRKHTATNLRDMFRKPSTEVECELEIEVEALAANSPVSIPLRSEVVRLTAYPNGVVVAHMEDRDAR